ncbi:MAG: hypothetical protein ACI841_003972 [Planctomycetota bacterium]|jgi:hypothetical protein
MNRLLPTEKDKFMTIPPGAFNSTRGLSRLRYSKTEALLLSQMHEFCGGELRGGAFHAQHEGVDLRVSFLPKHQGFIVAVGCELAGRFRVTRKGGLDRWMESFVPAMHFRSHDSRFDRKFGVQTRDLGLTSDILKKRKHLHAISELFERGVRSVHLDGEWLKVVIPRKAAGADPGPEFVLAMIERLALIAGAVTALARSRGSNAAPKNDPVVIGAWTLLGTLGVIGFGMIIGGSIVYTLVLPGRFVLPCLLLGLSAALPIIVALAFAVRQRTSPFGLVRGLAGLGLVVVPLFVAGALLLANGTLDTSLAKEHVARVIGKSVRENKNQLQYSVGLASWWTEGETRWLRVSKETYEQIEPHASRMRVSTHPGKLGHEWIEDFTVVP